MAVNEGALVRLQGQHLPEAPCTAHGQMSFVFSAPVCLFPSRRPQDSWNPCRATLLCRFPGSEQEGRYLDEVGSGAISDYSSTFSRTPPRPGIKIAL